jgi:hypothetical protein
MHWLDVVRNRLCAALAVAILAVGGHAHAAGLLASSADFKLLSWLGFKEAIDGAHAEGSTLNIYAWSMTWFKGKLYVGTLRNYNDGTVASLAPLTAQIWAYTPGGSDGASGTWALALQSPPGVLAPRESGYRWMIVCNFNGKDYLFVSTLGFTQGNVLRTSDGATWTPLTRVGYPAGTVGFRTISCFTEKSGKQLLVVSPVGKGGDATTFDTDASDNPIVLVNEDPVNAGTWRNYSALRMGDANNNAFFTIYAAGSYLYAGVNNDVTGAQVWRTVGCSLKQACIPAWTKVIDKGLGRPLASDGSVKNVGISDMMAFGDSIYMGVDVPTRNKPPAELWKLRISDNAAQVVIGEPRFGFGTGTVPSNPAYPANLRCGVPLEDLDGGGVANDCPPTSRQGAGFGPVGNQATGYPSGTNSYFWRLLDYTYDATAAPLGDNRLYAGTLDFGRNNPGTVPGFDLIASVDGTNWVAVTTDGAGDPKSAGMRAIASSPIGLFLGSANPARTNDPDSGGTNVWVGIPGNDKVAPATAIASPPSPNEGDTVASHTVSFSWAGTDAPAPGSLPLQFAYRLDPVEPAFSAFGGATSASYTQVPNGAYTFYVIARDQAGNTETPGAAPGASNRRSFTVSAPDLAPTVSITLAPSSPNPTGNVSLAWSGSDDLTPASGIRYDFWLSPLQADPAAFVAATSTSFASLADGAYTFHVIAKDGAGNTSSEATAAFTVARPPDPPATPAPASAALVGNGVVRVAWTDVAGETSYVIQRCSPGPFTGTCLVWLPITTLPADTTMYNDATGGASRTTYKYQVKACNANGCSAYAQTNTVTLP